MRIPTRPFALCLALAVSLAAPPAAGAQGDATAEARPTGNEIFAGVAAANARREAELQEYSSTREYSVAEPGRRPDADLVVAMQFVAPSTKTFGKASEQGVGWIHKRVFHGLMNAEREAASGKQKAESALTPANYDAELVGEDRYLDRDCWVLALRPKHETKYLLTGRVWIDKADLAIAKVEGDPVKSPSFWVRRAHLIRQYQRIDGFWLPLQDETHCTIRFVGEYTLLIKYSDYRVQSAGD